MDIPLKWYCCAYRCLFAFSGVVSGLLSLPLDSTGVFLFPLYLIWCPPWPPQRGCLGDAGQADMPCIATGTHISMRRSAEAATFILNYMSYSSQARICETLCCTVWRWATILGTISGARVESTAIYSVNRIREALCWRHSSDSTVWRWATILRTISGARVESTAIYSIKQCAPTWWCP